MNGALLGQATLKILDLSAGNRAVWFDKHYRDAVFVDLRPEVNPDIVADTRLLPLEVGEGYGLIVFDPPHVNFGKNAEMSKTYGWHTTDEIRDIIKRSAGEAHRVSRPDALMAFKWNDHDQKLDKVLGLMSEWWEPLFGHKTSTRTKHACMTCWVMLRRKSVPLIPASDSQSAESELPAKPNPSAFGEQQGQERG